MLFSGDLLFAGSIGRTDLPSGDPDAMRRSLAPGADPRRRDAGAARSRRLTTIGRERATNPYLQRGSSKAGRLRWRPPSQAPKGIPEYFPPESARVPRRPRRAVRPGASRPATATSSCRCSRTPRCSSAASVSRPTSSARRCTPSPTPATARSRCAPRARPGVIRSVIEHGMDRGGLPVKLWYAGPFFRAERPQHGRYRQFHQVGVEAVGVDDPALDAEVIAIGDEAFRGARPPAVPAEPDQPRRRQLPAGLPRAAPAVPRRPRPRRGHPAPRRDQPAAGARRQARGGPEAAGRRAADGRQPVRRLRAHYDEVREHLRALGVALDRGAARWSAASTTTPRRRSSSSTRCSARSRASAAAGATTG